MTKRFEPSAGGHTAFWVRLLPRASRNEVVGWTSSGQLKVRITAPPVDQAANNELVKLLAKRFGLRKADVRIVAGLRSRNKRVLVPSTCENRLSSFKDI